MIYLVVILNQSKYKRVVNAIKICLCFRNVTSFSEENIIEEIRLGTMAECVDETNVDRNSLLVDSFFFVLIIAKNLNQHGRPAVQSCLRYAPTPDHFFIATERSVFHGRTNDRLRFRHVDTYK